MMDTSGYCPPEPSAEVNAWFETSPEMTFTGVLEAGDAPPGVLAYCRARVAYHEHWMSDENAKNRPITVNVIDAGSYRLFDGPWIHYRDERAHLVVDAFFEEGEGLVLKRALPMETYQALIAAGDEVGCRRLAAAIYEARELHQRANRMLAGLTLDLGEALLDLD